ncbi:hypothetical protein [Burkholderia sp. 3C]
MEHFPPESFFPKGHRSGLIVVPSCAEHNQAKSTDDEYIRTLLLVDVRADGVKHLEGLREISRRAVARSLERSLAKLEEEDSDGVRAAEIHHRLDGLGEITAMKELDALVKDGRLRSSLHALATKSPVSVRFTSPSGQEKDAVSVEIDVARIVNYFSMGARALYYWIFKTQHIGKMILTPHFLMPTKHPDEAEQLEYLESLFDRGQSLGNQKEYFYYRIINGVVPLDQVNVEVTVLNFCLYDTYKVTATFLAGA